MKKLMKAFATFATGLITIALTTVPGRAAETLIVDFGPLSRSVSVDSLEAFAEDGIVHDDLEFYIQLLEPERQADLQRALTASRDIDLVKISQFYYTPIGERLLAYIGTLFQTGARLNGQKAFRAAVIATAAEDSEISLMDVLRNYPSESVRVNLPEVIRGAREVITEADETLIFVDAVKAQATADAASSPLNLARLPDLTQVGPYGVQRVELTLEDLNRQGQPLAEAVEPRTYPATLFLPASYGDFERPLPVVVISHGLGDTRSSFLNAGEHIASYGFAVVLPEHIGSNSDHKQAMYRGLESETFLASEFLNRPLDISFLLDELDQQNATDYQGQLDLNRVAVIGHSFGGYTALALGGATIDFARLASRCAYEDNVALDAALLLECRALELLDTSEAVQQLGETGVRDERVQLVMAYAPVSNLFGSRGMERIEIPTMILGGVFDIVAPVVSEQASAFSWLQTDEKYFYMAENTSHGPGITGFTSKLFHIDQQLDQSVDEGIDLTRYISRSLAVAFSQVYLMKNTDYEPFLSAAYAEAVSEEPFNFHRVRQIPDSVVELLDTPKP